jgi:hypothetical protein
VGDTLWVASYETRELILMDTDTLAVRRRIPFGTDSVNGKPISLVSDGASVWVSDGDGVVTRLDATTGAQTSRLQLPATGIRLDGIDSRGVLYADNGSGNAIFKIMTGAGGAPDEFGDELHVTSQTGGTVAAVALTAGAIWVATTGPDELLRVDLQSFQVTARGPLEGLNDKSNVPVALAAIDDAVWVRIVGKVVEVAP